MNNYFREKALRNKKLVKSLLRDNHYASTLKLKCTGTDFNGLVSYWEDLNGNPYMFKFNGDESRILDVSNELEGGKCIIIR